MCERVVGSLLAGLGVGACRLGSRADFRFVVSPFGGLLEGVGSMQ